MIRVSHLTKSYPLQGLRRHYVYRDLSIELPGKTHIGVVGRNGAGKSTFLRLLSRVEYPEAGRIEADGSISPPLGLTSGFAQQLSGRDNARFVCRINGDTQKEMEKRMAFVEEFAGIGEFFDQAVQTYSSGMRARLAFGISLAFRYQYYLIDEITAVGDQRFRERSAHAINQLRGRSSIIMVSHNLGQLAQDCQAGLYIRSGEAIFYPRIQDAIRDYKQDNIEP